MPLGLDLGMNIGWIVYLIVVFALVVTFAVLLIRLILAATRALNAYTDDKKLQTAVALDELDPVEDRHVH
ncbi:putative membrane protein [Okibacterium sp. HSC-33S16]|uniref:hypothetical protein n=1 Tax=Okibacterium sp. HSC-33S16 TaxID=2910965 RepID=UPI0020A1E3B2|nr:hypothetical protein [Okibacterium sp. HSC-33S16]MCP2032682.1 putative membrane protein [Okibacterium sp. HSC-33S16]